MAKLSENGHERIRKYLASLNKALLTVRECADARTHGLKDLSPANWKKAVGECNYVKKYDDELEGDPSGEESGLGSCGALGQLVGFIRPQMWFGSSGGAIFPQKPFKSSGHGETQRVPTSVPRPDICL